MRRLALTLALALAPAGPVAADIPGSTTPPLPVATATPLPAVASPAAAPDRAGYSYDYAVYDSRYGDTYLAFDAYKPFGPRTRLRPFVDAAVVRDTRSGNGDVPLILNDNYLLAAVGLQYTDPSGVRLFAQAGGTTPFGPIAAQPSGGDVRTGAQFYRDVGTPYASHAVYGSVFTSGTYYSRYSDAILYAQGESVANLAGSARPLEIFARPVLTLDTRSHYYSNLFETTLGMRYHPFGTASLSISVEGVAGWYVRGAVRPGGTAAFYTDFRPTLAYGFSF